LYFASHIFRNADMTKPAKPAGRQAVLDLVKRQGPVSADDMAARLGITGMAVRQHLQALSAEGVVRHVQEARGVGRPVKLWHATAAAAARFPDAHSALAVDLLGQMKKAFGDDGLDRILKLRTAVQERAYRSKTDAARTLKTKLQALAKIRSHEGYMAEVRRDPAPGAYLFLENHCPVCAAARICQGLCREELALFQRVLGPGVTVTRTDHILAGAGRCAYRVAPIA
jgi:predicted ArsR family transcriptional regulator